MTDEKHWWWKGDEAKYSAIHMWIRKKLGTATKCEDCGIKGRSRYHWHCINKKYNRNLNNYVQLCPVCHKKRHKIEDSQRKVSKV